MIRRIVEPELLDSLPPDDPRAIHSRRDLRLINSWMGNARHIARAISVLPRPPERVLELGAGDGSLMVKIAWALPNKAEITFLDMQPVIPEATLARLRSDGRSVRVISSRIEDWLKPGDSTVYDVVIANLFLHHFEEAQLKLLFQGVAKRTAAFISCDPRRWLPALWTARLLWVLGCNSVTRNDARISVRAGFQDQELTALWPADAGFDVREAPAGFSSHLFAAVKRAC